MNDMPTQPQPGIVETLNSIQRLTKDLKEASKTLSDKEARFLVDAYYAMQRDRIRADHQERTLSEGPEPHDVMSWLAEQRGTLEKQVQRALDAYSGAHPVGQWARSIVGVGPVIAAGMLANIDIKQAPTVGHIWRFAGLDPTLKWEKATKRPWNGSLKRLMWLLGESFVKVSGHERDTYGRVYKARKEAETRKNEAGAFAEQAAASLAAKKFGADTEARKHYTAGKLPPARIHLRAERYSVKLFLSHLHLVWYFHEFNTLPPRPYILTAEGGHAHFIGPPNPDLLPGLEAALQSMQPGGRRAPLRRSEPDFRRAPEAESEPDKARVPMAQSEPESRRAPLAESEPARQRAPKAGSEPKSKRVPKAKT